MIMSFRPLPGFEKSSDKSVGLVHIGAVAILTEKERT
jgi:hypothetical protein